MPTIYQIILVALITAFIILFLNKTELRTKLRDFFDSKKINLLAELIDCDFCLSFWICLCVALGFMLLSYELTFIFTPFFATPITRFLL